MLALLVLTWLSVVSGVFAFSEVVRFDCGVPGVLCCFGWLCVICLRCLYVLTKR